MALVVVVAAVVLVVLLFSYLFWCDFRLSLAQRFLFSWCRFAYFIASPRVFMALAVLPQVCGFKWAMTNFMLSETTSEGTNYGEMLKEARHLSHAKGELPLSGRRWCE